MKLRDYKERKDVVTAKASEISRQLTLAGIAIIWIFKKTDGNKEILDKFLLWPLIFLSLSIIADLLQYFIAGEIWRKFYRVKEHRLNEEIKNNPQANRDPEITHDKEIIKPIEVFYWVKLSLLIVAYLLITIFLIRNITFQ